MRAAHISGLQAQCAGGGTRSENCSSVGEPSTFTPLSHAHVAKRSSDGAPDSLPEDTSTGTIPQDTQSFLVHLVLQLLFQKGSKPLHKPLLNCLQNSLAPQLLSRHLDNALENQMVSQVSKDATKDTSSASSESVPAGGLCKETKTVSKSTATEGSGHVATPQEMRLPLPSDTGIACAPAWASLLAFKPAAHAIAVGARLALNDLADGIMHVLANIQAGQHIAPGLAIELQVLPLIL
jgi:hypothetical protein